MTVRSNKMYSFRFWIFATGSLVVLTLSFYLSAKDARQVYPFQSKKITLEGSLKEETRFGPPGYGESPETDSKRKILVLILDRAIDVGTKETFNDVDIEIISNQKIIQVFFFREEQHAMAKKLLGKKVRIIGSLSTGVTGGHYYPVLFAGTLIERVK